MPGDVRTAAAADGHRRRRFPRPRGRPDRRCRGPGHREPWSPDSRRPCPVRSTRPSRTRTRPGADGPGGAGRRGRHLYRVAGVLRDHAEVLARLETIDSGKPLSQARADVAVSARYFEYYAGMADKIGAQTIPQPPGTFSYTVREPYGVVAHITPWNAPLSQLARGVAPCLAAGNTVVVKPSELTPLTSLLAARLMVEAGLPPGVCNVVLGTGIPSRRTAHRQQSGPAHHLHRISRRLAASARSPRSGSSASILSSAVNHPPSSAPTPILTRPRRPGPWPSCGTRGSPASRRPGCWSTEWYTAVSSGSSRRAWPGCPWGMVSRIPTSGR